MQKTGYSKADLYYYIKNNRAIQKLEEDISTIDHYLSFKPSISPAKLGKKRYFLHCFMRDQKNETPRPISRKSLLLSRYLSKFQTFYY